MTTSVACRRKQTRHEIPVEEGATVSFNYPNPAGEHVTMTLRDISASGISFMIGRELPGLDEGRSINDVAISWGKKTIHADLLVMHLTPDASPGSVCGALIYPTNDEDILALQALSRVI